MHFRKWLVSCPSTDHVRRILDPLCLQELHQLGHEPLEESYGARPLAGKEIKIPQQGVRAQGCRRRRSRFRTLQSSNRAPSQSTFSKDFGLQNEKKGISTGDALTTPHKNHQATTAKPKWICIGYGVWHVPRGATRQNARERGAEHGSKQHSARVTEHNSNHDDNGQPVCNHAQRLQNTYTQVKGANPAMLSSEFERLRISDTSVSVKMLKPRHAKLQLQTTSDLRRLDESSSPRLGAGQRGLVD